MNVFLCNFDYIFYDPKLTIEGLIQYTYVSLSFECNFFIVLTCKFSKQGFVNYHKNRAKQFTNCFIEWIFQIKA